MIKIKRHLEEGLQNMKKDEKTLQRKKGNKWLDYEHQMVCLEEKK